MKKLILLVALMLAISSPAYARGFSGGFHSSFSSSHSSFSSGSRSSYSSGSRSSGSRSNWSLFGGSKSSSSKVSLTKSSGTSSTYRSGRSSFSGGASTSSHVVYSRSGRATGYYYGGHSYHYSYYSPYHDHFWSFQSGLMWGSLWHPFGGVYGYGASSAYYPPSAGVGIIDFIMYLVFLAILFFVIKAIFFRPRRMTRW